MPDIAVFKAPGIVLVPATQESIEIVSGLPLGDSFLMKLSKLDAHNLEGVPARHPNFANGWVEDVPSPAKAVEHSPTTRSPISGSGAQTNVRNRQRLESHDISTYLALPPPRRRG